MGLGLHELVNSSQDYHSSIFLKKEKYITSNNKIDELNIEIINSQKFSEISDFIYSEITTHEDFISKSLKNELTIIQKKMMIRLS